jgi:ribonuclease P protein component
LTVDETYVSAKRAQAEAQARIPGADGDASGSRDPEAQTRTRPQAAVRLTARRISPAMTHPRPKRLSRSRDFDVVYRRGSSVATRFLVLYRFPREDGAGDTRLGLAVPRSAGGAVTRNRLKRQLREAWGSIEAPDGNDYVLIARPGLAESVESRGFDWLRERVVEIVQKAAA